MKDSIENKTSHEMVSKQCAFAKQKVGGRNTICLVQLNCLACVDNVLENF